MITVFAELTSNSKQQTKICVLQAVVEMLCNCCNYCDALMSSLLSAATAVCSCESGGRSAFPGRRAEFANRGLELIVGSVCVAYGYTRDQTDSV